MKTSKKMKRKTAAALAVVAALAIIGCAGGPKVNTTELDNKGRAIGVSTPDWIKLYVATGITAVQAQPQFEGQYCIIGDETSANRQFALAWADNFSAQQRIGAMLRTNIASKYQATVSGAAQSSGTANSSAATETGSADYRQEIDNVVNAVVNVSYSGAQRDSDWWVLMRRYDPDQKDVYSDEYTAYVLYTVPKAELNRQIAMALETGVSKDSALYDITLQIAREILSEGFEYLGAGDLASAETLPQTPAEVQAAIAAGLSGKAVIRNNSSRTASVMSSVKIYRGYEAKGLPFMTYDSPVLGGQQASWDLPEGIYTFETFLNDRTDSQKEGEGGYGTNSGTSTVGITVKDSFAADFVDGGLTSFSRK
ncbi:MAG: hypothetical protein LBJ86_05830 [Spirochaetaceae bacterium]|jgi:hypothetical protein|nr:hypothetical protein [Spirochaetaceae bacterium]